MHECIRVSSIINRERKREDLDNRYILKHKGGMVPHTYNPNTWEEDQESKASLRYITSSSTEVTTSDLVSKEVLNGNKHTKQK